VGIYFVIRILSNLIAEMPIVIPAYAGIQAPKGRKLINETFNLKPLLPGFPIELGMTTENSPEFTTRNFL